jgi:polar amino acid transport system substrate-binding protein
MLVQQSALVRADAPLRSVKELDRAGHVIGVNTDDSVSVWLKQHLTEARLRPTPDFSLREGVQWLEAREVVAFAGGRARLLSATGDVSGLRILDDNFYGVPQAIAVPLDRSDRLQAINAALAEMKQSGFLAEAVKRSGIDGIAVAP